MKKKVNRNCILILIVCLTLGTSSNLVCGQAIENSISIQLPCFDTKFAHSNDEYRAYYEETANIKFQDGSRHYMLPISNSISIVHKGKKFDLSPNETISIGGISWQLKHPVEPGPIGSSWPSFNASQFVPRVCTITGKWTADLANEELVYKIQLTSFHKKVPASFEVAWEKYTNFANKTPGFQSNFRMRPLGPGLNQAKMLGIFFRTNKKSENYMLPTIFDALGHKPSEILKLERNFPKQMTEAHQKKIQEWRKSNPDKRFRLDENDNPVLLTQHEFEKIWKWEANKYRTRFFTNIFVFNRADLPSHYFSHEAFDIYKCERVANPRYCYRLAISKPSKKNGQRNLSVLPSTLSE